MRGRGHVGAHAARASAIDWRARSLALLAALSLAASVSLMLLSGTSRSQQAGAATADSSFSKTVTLQRDHLINGADSVVDSRTVSVKVDVTQGLRDRQGVGITWSGAHPTGGVVYDNTSSFAANQEYPVAILQCRGVDSADVPLAQQLSPTSCYTQTPELRYQPPFRGDFPAYRLDRYASPAARAKSVGGPVPRPTACDTGDGAERWVPFVAADGTRYYGGANGCAGLAPEQSVLSSSLSPASTTFGTTALDGTGRANFIVQNAEGNASLGCSDTVACAIVIIPIMGISCDASAASLPAPDRPVDALAAQKDCGTKGFYQPGELGTQSNADTNSQVAVNGQLWWSASNWRNRITVPISMAQTAAVCDVTGGGTPENIYGSQLLVQVTQQWAPKFCLDPALFRLQQVQTSEIQAKNLLASGVTNGQYLGVKAAFQAGPPAAKFSNPVVQAPTAISGFSIVYLIDDQQQHAYTKLKLNARLLAKLMTMSYPAIPAIRSDWANIAKYKQLANNPLDMSVDPEFLALNPDAKTQFINDFFGTATLFSTSSDSDVTTALTSYINADPEARSWLDGQPDPWGMRVNPNYQKIALPVTSWPQLDTYYNSLNNACIADGKLPILPLIAGPVSDPSQVTFNMQYGISNSQVNCVVTGQSDSADNRRLGPIGRQDNGIRFLVGVVGLGDVARYGLRPAALQTQKAASAPAKFSDAGGRTFVQPTPDSLLAAAKLFQADTELNTWTVPYSTLRTAAAGAQAYPGTMLISTDVPTKGLATADAANFSKLLSYSAGPGQVHGAGNGQLPGGYLPITKANGLGALVDYTALAATAVAAQNGEVPLVTGASGSGGSSASPSTSGSLVGGSSGGSGTSATPGIGSSVGGHAGAVGGSRGGPAAPLVSTAATTAAPKLSTALQVRPAGSTSAVAPGWLGYAVPGLAVIGLLSAAASALISGVGRR